MIHIHIRIHNLFEAHLFFVVALTFGNYYSHMCRYMRSKTMIAKRKKSIHKSLSKTLSKEKLL